MSIRAFSTLAALAFGLTGAGTASAVTFGLDFDRTAGEIQFTVSLDQPLDQLIGYELAIRYDDAEVSWDAFSNATPAIDITPAVGVAGHDADGMKAVALSILGTPFSATTLFTVSFTLDAPVDDGAFDDFLVMLAPSGCALLPGGCTGIPTVDGLLFATGVAPNPIENPGFRVEIGAETTRVQAIPEPALAALLASALAPLAALRRR
jgi:hypothetical protein